MGKRELRPRQEWIEVPVPALVNEEVFALAQEQLQKNAHHSLRRTVEPTLLQGMLVEFRVKQVFPDVTHLFLCLLLCFP